MLHKDSSSMCDPLYHWRTLIFQKLFGMSFAFWHEIVSVWLSSYFAFLYSTWQGSRDGTCGDCKGCFEPYLMPSRLARMEVDLPVHFVSEWMAEWHSPSKFLGQLVFFGATVKQRWWIDSTLLVLVSCLNLLMLVKSAKRVSCDINFSSSFGVSTRYWCRGRLLNTFCNVDTRQNTETVEHSWWFPVKHGTMFIAACFIFWRKRPGVEIDFFQRIISK